MTVSLLLRCAGCAATVDPLEPGLVSPLPFRCPNAETDPNIDHVLAWDPVSAGVTAWPASEKSPNPYVRYRTLQHAYWLNRALGASDEDHVALVESLDAAIADVGGTGFRTTPFVELDDAAAEFGIHELWAKVETHNVGGSHKARHLMGILLHLEARRLPASVPLGIASCGNAAIAASTLAQAARRHTQVFIPDWAQAPVRNRLTGLGASLTECPRVESDPPGDPCLHRFHEALDDGALPFCVQGSENGFTIDGGASLGHELADQFAAAGFVPDRLFIQVGGGALGASVARGLRDALAFGVINHLPKLHYIQAIGCAPLARAWRRVASRALRSLGQDHELPDDGSLDGNAAAILHEESSRQALDEALTYAVTHRDRYMWPWENEPVSIATGILDDETYDWAALLRAMFSTGGWPIVASEHDFERSLALAPASAETDATGASGLAGVVALADRSGLSERERVAVLLTGVRRS